MTTERHEGQMELKDILPFVQLIARFCELAMSAGPPPSNLPAQFPSENGSHATRRHLKSTETDEEDDEPDGPPALIGDGKYSIGDAARFLKVAKVTVTKKVQKGTIESHKEGTRRVIMGHEIARHMHRDQQPEISTPQ